ncbi:hypothetical protein [Aquimarina atlantica]|nr:hypothetical protein [Aquimarina atlantica]
MNCNVECLPNDCSEVREKGTIKISIRSITDWLKTFSVPGAEDASRFK